MSAKPLKQGASHPSLGTHCHHLYSFRTFFVLCSVGDTEINGPQSLHSRSSLLVWGNGPCSLKNKLKGPNNSGKEEIQTLQRLRGGKYGFLVGKGWGKWHLSCILKVDNTLQLDSHIPRAFLGYLLCATYCLWP